MRGRNSGTDAIAAAGGSGRSLRRSCDTDVNAGTGAAGVAFANDAPRTCAMIGNYEQAEYYSEVRRDHTGLGTQREPSLSEWKPVSKSGFGKTLQNIDKAGT